MEATISYLKSYMDFCWHKVWSV